jgi:hypothetical protein
MNRGPGPKPLPDHSPAKLIAKKLITAYGYPLLVTKAEKIRAVRVAPGSVGSGANLAEVSKIESDTKTLIPCIKRTNVKRVSFLVLSGCDRKKVLTIANLSAVHALGSVPRGIIGSSGSGDKTECRDNTDHLLLHLVLPRLQAAIQRDANIGRAQVESLLRRG